MSFGEGYEKNADVKDWKGVLKIGETKKCLQTLNCEKKLFKTHAKE